MWDQISLFFSLVNIEYECQFESPGPRNELEWTLNDEILKTEIFDENSRNFTFEYVFVSKFSLNVDRSYFGSRIGCRVSKQDSNGYLLQVPISLTLDEQLLVQ